MNRAVELLDLLLAVAGGLVFAACLWRWWRLGRRDPLRGSPLRSNSLWLLDVWLIIGIYVLGISLGSQMAKGLAPAELAGEGLVVWQGVFGTSVAQILIVAACLAMARRSFAAGIRGFGIGRNPPSRDLVWALGGWLVAIAATRLVVFATQVVIHWWSPDFQAPEHGVFQTLENPAVRTWMRAVAIAGAFLLAPIGEEMLFRGVLQTSLRKVLPPRTGSLAHRWAAVAAAGALFGLVHSSTPHHVPALIVLGILLGFLYERTGSLVVPVLVHMLFNGKSLLWSYLVGQPSQ
ncbi:MAG: hypothetical protein AMXMBFR13_05390 [Phycisphaerae bacterium]